MKKLLTNIYSISRAHRKVTVWTAETITGMRIGTSTCTPDKGMTEAQRRKVISEYLKNRFKINYPV